MKKAILEIKKIAQIQKISPFYKNKPWGNQAQGYFINLCLNLKTNLGPWQLLLHLKKIEKKLGRTKTKKWGNRTIDLDIIFYNQTSFCVPKLVIPHKFAYKRLFVLKPLQKLFTH